MTTLKREDRDLHHSDGTHRYLPPKIDARTDVEVAVWERRIRAHLEAHEVAQSEGRTA